MSISAAGQLDPGLTGRDDRPVPGIDNGYLAGYRVRFDEAGPDARIRTSALLRYAQDVAWRHSEALGFDRRWYTERGLWWVVRSVELEVTASIPMGHTLRVSTAVVGHRRIWARRLSTCRLADGEIAATVTTDWVLVDERGRIVRIPADFGLSFSNPELPGDILRVAASGSRLGGASDGPVNRASDPLRHGLQVRPADLDPVGHVNNAVYLDWVEEALAAAGGEPATTALPRRYRVEYQASALPGQRVIALANLSGSTWTVVIRGEGGDDLVRAAGSSDAPETIQAPLGG